MDMNKNINSTIGIDMSTFNILEDKITVAVWDFAGQPQYITTHQVSKLFLLN